MRLNDRPKDPQIVLRPLRELSPGQRCSAIRPILLLSGEYPLVIDQPEENLDNRLIRRVIVKAGAQWTVFQTEAVSKSQATFSKNRRPSQGPPLGPV